MENNKINYILNSNRKKETDSVLQGFDVQGSCWTKYLAHGGLVTLLHHIVIWQVTTQRYQTPLWEVKDPKTAGQM